MGGVVPTGLYDRAKGTWETSEDGCVIKVMSESDDMAEIDIDGDDAADDAAELGALGFTDAERRRVAELYEPEQTLWRSRLRHFSPADGNWFTIPVMPDDADWPPGRHPTIFDWFNGRMCRRGGSILDMQNQTLG